MYFAEGQWNDWFFHCGLPSLLDTLCFVCS